jgi:hypothetical protein
MPMDNKEKAIIVFATPKNKPPKKLGVPPMNEEKEYQEDKPDQCEYCEGDGCEHCNYKGYHEEDNYEKGEEDSHKKHMDIIGKLLEKLKD